MINRTMKQTEMTLLRNRICIDVRIKNMVLERLTTSLNNNRNSGTESPISLVLYNSVILYIYIQISI